MENFIANLLQGKYDIAEEICKTTDEKNIKEMIMMVSYDTENICVYDFVQYMIRRTGKASWIKLAIDIMLHPLCFLEGAYSVALFHARELLIIERSVENLERIIFFHNMPEKLVDEDEAKSIAKEILAAEPNNKVALGIYKDFEKENKK